MAISAQDILDEISDSELPLGMTMWEDGPSDGGYVIRKDGAVFAIGEFQEAREHTYSKLSELSARERAKIFAHLCDVDHWLEGFNDDPSVYGYADPKTLSKWISKRIAKKSEAPLAKKSSRKSA